MKLVFATIGLTLMIGLPFWLATRPFKNKKTWWSGDNLTKDRADPNSQNYD